MKYLFLIVAPFILFADVATNGESLYSKNGCYGCHGANGKGSGDYPILANKPKDYLIKKLNKYKNMEIKTSRADIMNPFARVLKDKDIIALATFLSKVSEQKEENGYELGFNPWDGGGS